MLRYKQLVSKTILSHPRLTVVEDQIELPGGDLGNYLWFAGRRDAVTIIPRNSKGEILVEQEYSYLPDTKVFQFPGGGIEEGEQPVSAAQRELAEEINSQAARLTLIGSYLLDHRRSRSVMHLFLGEELTSCTSPFKDKYEIDLQAFWMSETEVDHLIAAGKVVNAAMLSSWILYKSHK